MPAKLISREGVIHPQNRAFGAGRAVNRLRDARGMGVEGHQQQGKGFQLNTDKFAAKFAQRTMQHYLKMLTLRNIV